MKAVAIMQPYFFPYLGYFKLVELADVFLLYGEVSFRKKSWITRNRFQASGATTEHWLGVPVVAKSSHRPIRETRLSRYAEWKPAFLNAVRGAYETAPFFPSTDTLLRQLLEPSFDSIHRFNAHCLQRLAAELHIRTPIEVSGSESAALEAELSATHGIGTVAARTERVIRLTQAFGGDRYLNPASGRELYAIDLLAGRGIAFTGVDFALPVYSHGHTAALPGLSIIDVLMHNGLEATRQLLAGCRVSTP